MRNPNGLTAVMDILTFMRKIQTEYWLIPCNSFWISFRRRCENLACCKEAWGNVTFNELGGN